MDSASAGPPPTERHELSLIPDVERDATRLALPIVPPDSFVGRSREHGSIRFAMENRAGRLLTIIGPGGVGKTRLALAVAHDLAPAFRDGVCFISFTQRAPDAIWETIARALGISNAARAPWSDAVRDALRTRETLLVLDGCESVITEFAELPVLLATCPGVAVLATSREALRVRGEQEFWLDPLDLPDATTEWSVEALREEAAIALFAMRAQRVDPHFTVTEENARDLIAIVRTLDGLPLAIELAAAQIRHLSPTALLQRLDAALPSLGGGPRDLPARQQSLRNTVEWSLSLLDPQDRTAFLQLAVFVGGFTPDAAITVVGGISNQDGWELLLSFADKSLLKRVVGDNETGPRFLMLETVRAVTLDLLRRDPELFQEARTRHARYFIALAREADRNYHGPDQLMWLQHIDMEHANITAIMERGFDNDHDVRLALELAAPMFWYWYTRGYHMWALPLIERLLTHATGHLPAELREPAHITAGWLAFKQAQVDRADRHFTASFSPRSEMRTRSALLGRIGAAYVLAFDRSDTPKAIDMLRQVIHLARDVEGAWHEEAAGHFGIGLLTYFDGHLHAARTSFVESIRIARAHADRQSISMNLVYLARIDRLTGEPETALWKLQEALPLLFEVGDRATIALALDAVVAALVALDEHRLALQILAVADHLRQTAGLPRSPLEQQDIDEPIDAIHARLGHDPAPVNAERQRITLNEAIELLLQFQPAKAARQDDAPSQASPSSAPSLTASTLLSSREIEVLELVASGLTAAEIATTLFVSRHTVKRHMANIRQKLGVRSQAAAVAVLQRGG